MSRLLQTLPRLALGAIALAAQSVSAADWQSMFETHIHQNAQGEKLPYRLLKPATLEPGRRYPLVLFLHGAGERGDDNAAQLKWGMEQFASEAVRGRYPAFVVAPQCPTDKRWVEVPWSDDAHTLPEEPSTPLRLALELIDSLRKELPVDDGRIYATGLSMGAFGVWDALCRRPELFAAAAPICGGGDPAQAQRIAHVPVWAFHGGSDTVVKPHRSREMVAALAAAGAEPKHTEYPGVAHNSWSPTYDNPELYAWLFAQRK